MKDKKSASLFQKEQVMESLKQSFVKLNPRVMIKNPIMFTVELVTLVMLVVCINLLRALPTTVPVSKVWATTLIFGTMPAVGYLF